VSSDAVDVELEQKIANGDFLERVVSEIALRCFEFRLEENPRRRDPLETSLERSARRAFDPVLGADR
jgi:hypothetical protein